MPDLGGNSGTPATDEQRFSDLDTRIEVMESAVKRMSSDLLEVRTTLGTAPDPLNGKPGSGAVGVLYRLANHVMTGESRNPMESFLEESEDTKIQNRNELIARARTSEQRVKLAIIGAVVTALTTLGTVLAAYLAGGTGQ